MIEMTSVFSKFTDINMSTKSSVGVSDKKNNINKRERERERLVLKHR